MGKVELIPVDKGNRLTLDPTGVTTIGRTPNIGCLDKKISRNHAELYIKPDGTVWIKPIHHNPTFYRTQSSPLKTLTKDQEHQLNDKDEIGLLPDEYFYCISIESTEEEDEEEEEFVIGPSTTPKSPKRTRKPSPMEEEEEASPTQEKEREKSPAKDPSLEPEGGIILHTTRALPAWMSKRAALESTNTKGRSKGKPTVTPTKKTPSPSKYRTYIGRKKVEGIEYDDDDDDAEEEDPSEASAPPTAEFIAPAAKAPPKRERCPYGKFCYRKNPIHRQEAIHPGDPDWDNKENDVDQSKPECPFGTECYRKNPDHFREYTHTIKQSAKQRRSKRKASGDDEDDDDDGLPNEYDYNDSFIDDEEMEDSVRVDRAADSLGDPDNDWKPHRKARQTDDEDDENNSSDESEVNLLNEEAADFIQESSLNHQRPAKKKARIQMPKDDD